MKKITLLAFLLGVITNISFSQSTNVQLDKRAYKYYTPEEIKSMPPNKIKKINYVYRHSFIIPEKFKGQIDPNDIDIRKYSRYRKLHEQAKVYLIDKTKDKIKGESDYNLSDKYIYLISIDDLRDAYDKIDAGLIDE